MLEFLIRRTDGEWFDARLDACHPTTVPYELIPGWGNVRMKIAGTEVSVSDEDPGLQISFEGEIDAALARRVVDEMLQNLEAATGQQGRIVEL